MSFSSNIKAMNTFQVTRDASTHYSNQMAPSIIQLDSGKCHML